MVEVVAPHGARRACVPQARGIAQVSRVVRLLASRWGWTCDAHDHRTRSPHTITTHMDTDMDMWTRTWTWTWHMDMGMGMGMGMGLCEPSGIIVWPLLYSRTLMIHTGPPHT